VLRRVFSSFALIFAACGETAPPATSAADAAVASAPDAAPVVNDDAAAAVVHDDAAMVGIADAAAPGADAGSQPDAAAAAGLDLTGVWAARVVNSQCFNGGLAGRDTVQITTLFRVELAQNGLVVSTMTTPCSVDLTPFGGNQTTYPAAAITAIMTPGQTSHLSEARIGATYTPDERVSLLGWRAAQGQDPKTAMVPEDENDARLVDADNDTHPGVTLTVSGRLSGDIYIANRNIVNITGTVISADRIQGRSNTVQIQHIVASSNRLLGLSSIDATPNPDPASSSYDLIRIPAGPDTCAQIIAQKATLFPAPGPVTPCPM